jgi:Zn ribbon nucleic-acid-binding protein
LRQCIPGVLGSFIQVIWWREEQIPIAEVVEIMKRKRAVHEHVINAAQQQKAAAKAFEKVCI